MNTCLRSMLKKQWQIKLDTNIYKKMGYILAPLMASKVYGQTVPRKKNVSKNCVKYWKNGF